MKRISANSGVFISSLPLWTHNTPNYAVALLAACAKKQGVRITAGELEILFYHHVNDTQRRYWIADEGPFWDQEAGPQALFAQYRDSFFIPHFKKLLDDGVEIIAFSVNNRSLAFTRLAVALLKELDTECYVILGGPTAFSTPELLCAIEGVDSICLGEGDLCFPSFLHQLVTSGAPQEFDGFLLRRDDGTFTQSTRVRGPQSLDSCPFPDYSSFNMRLYNDQGTVPTAVSRGCLQRCTYCAESPHFGRFRSRSGKSLFDEAQYHIQSCGLSSIRLMLNDSMINGDLQSLEEFADCLIGAKLKITFGGMAVARPDMSFALLEKLKKAGCNEMSFGIESGSPEVLQLMHKKLHTPESATRVLADCKKVGIRTTAYLIVGFPGEQERHFYETLNFIRQNFDNIDCLMVNKLLLLPGSKIAQNPERYGISQNRDESGNFQTLDGANTLAIRNARQEVMRLLFQEKIAFIDKFEVHGANPVRRLLDKITNLQVALNKINGMQAEIRARTSGSSSNAIVSLWKNEARPLWQLNEQIRSINGNTFQSLGNDPFLVGPTFQAGARQPRWVKLVFRHSLAHSTWAQIYWLFRGQSEFKEEYSVRFLVPLPSVRGESEVIYVDLREQLSPELFEEPIVQLRIDPLEQKGEFTIEDVLIF